MEAKSRCAFAFGFKFFVANATLCFSAGKPNHLNLLNHWFSFYQPDHRLQ